MSNPVIGLTNFFNVSIHTVDTLNISNFACIYFCEIENLHMAA